MSENLVELYTRCLSTGRSLKDLLSDEEHLGKCQVDTMNFAELEKRVLAGYAEGDLNITHRTLKNYVIQGDHDHTEVIVAGSSSGRAVVKNGNLVKSLDQKALIEAIEKEKIVPTTYPSFTDLLKNADNTKNAKDSISEYFSTDFHTIKSPTSPEKSRRLGFY